MSPSIAKVSHTGSKPRIGEKKISLFGCFRSYISIGIKEFWPIFAVALISWFSVVICLDPAGSYPSLPEGPGLTIDEVFNVQQGSYLARMTQSLGWLNLIPGTSQEAYQVKNGYLPDHPPLGRIWLGVHHEFVRWLFPPLNPDGEFITACARTGSATAFALTVLLIGLFATIWFGRSAGIMTSISLVLMPRLFGHAHLASLETITNLTYTATVLSVAHWWNREKAPSKLTALLTGVLMGLALLTKIQAILIPIPVACWVGWRWRTQGIVPLAIWSFTAAIVFYAGWPYLWSDTANHILEYLGRTTNRATLYVWYFGHKYPDKLVPWHYPFVIFGLTVPILLHVLGAFELVQSLIFRRSSIPTSSPLPMDANSTLESRASIPATQILIQNDNLNACDLLLIACLSFPLVVFALPGVAVYDCERLFLISFPLWAIFIGRGWVSLYSMLNRRTKSWQAAGAICAGLLIQAAFPLYSRSPCQLCYYNEVTSLVLGGVDRAGLEVDYWGVGITRSFLRRAAEIIPEGSNVGVSPTLHHLQASEYQKQSPILRSHQLKTVECDLSSPNRPPFVIVYRRRADCPDLWNLTEPTAPLATKTIGGESLGYLLRLD